MKRQQSFKLFINQEKTKNISFRQSLFSKKSSYELSLVQGHKCETFSKMPERETRELLTISQYANKFSEIVIFNFVFFIILETNISFY